MTSQTSTDHESCAVDPHQLLKALATLLTPQGQIKSCEEVSKILNLMKSAKKLVSRCIYANILRATTDKEVMDKFVADGGWELLNGWLQEAKTSDNTPFILELIKVFKQLPVTIDILKKNNTAKLIKQMTKGDADEMIKEVANEVVDSWLLVIRNHQQKGDSTKDKSTNVVKKLKIKKVEKKDGHDEAETKSATKRTNSDNNDSKSRTKDDSAHTDKKPRRDSVDDNVPLSKIKKGQTESKNAPSSSKAKAPVKTEEEVKKRPRTAKVPPSKFRSTGLEKDAKLPPIKIKKKNIIPPPASTGLKPKSDKILPVKREGPIFSKSLTPPDKKPKVTSPTQIKPPKPKPHIVQESSMFISALNAPAPVVRKKRRPSNKPTSPTTNKTEPKLEPPKFGFYAAIQQDEEKKDNKSNEKTEEETKAEEAGEETNGVKKKKSVRWRKDADLVEVRYFELDATERVNVNKTKDFRDAAHNEMMMERQAMKNAMKGVFSEDGIMPGEMKTIEYFPWSKLHRINLHMIQVVDYGKDSKERDVQKHREMVVLSQIYFDKNMVPESPQEPDAESYNPQEPKKIPLEDETAVETTQHSGMLPMFQHDPQQHAPQFNNMPSNMPGGLNLQNLDIPPDLQQILQQIPLQGGGGHPGPQQPHMQGNNASAPPNATITNVQNLLSSMMDNQGTSAQEDLTNRLREMLEPFKHQFPGMNMGQGPPNPGMPPHDGMGGPPFGNPGDFGGMPPQMMGGPGGMPPGGPGGMMPPNFQDGPGPQGMGPRFGGPGGPPFHPGGPEFPPGPEFQGGPDFQGGPNWNGGPPQRGRGHGQRRRGRGRGGQGQGGRPVCRHFMSPNGCRVGNACMFYHPGVHGPPLNNGQPNGPVPLLPNP